MSMTAPFHVTSDPVRTLAWLLRFDAASGAATALLLLPLHGWLAPRLGLSETVLLVAGALGIVCAGLMGYASADAGRRRGWVWAVVIGNFAWVCASVFLVVGPATPTALGTTVLLAQGVAVLVLAMLEYRAVTMLPD